MAMECNVLGVKGCSFDYPGKAAATVMLGSCVCGNQDCEFRGKTEKMSLASLQTHLAGSPEAAIFISGCEPLEQADVCREIAAFAKKNKKFVGIRTTGVHHSALSDLVSEKLIDFIRLDVRLNSKSSVGLVRASGLEYEFYASLRQVKTKKGIEELHGQLQPFRLLALEGPVSDALKPELLEFVGRHKNVVLRLWD